MHGLFRALTPGPTSRVLDTRAAHAPNQEPSVLSRRTRWIIPGVLSAATCAAATDFPEIEPNDTKAAATAVGPMTAGDRIVGRTTGAATDAPGIASADYFRVRTAEMPPGVYLHRLTIATSGPAGHTGTLRGRTQSGGVINPNSDAAVQVSSTTTMPPRYVQWYGTGREEEIFFRVAGTSATSGDYYASLQSLPVTPTPIGPFVTGEIIISTIGRGHDSDTDLWVYDAALNPLPGYGNDDESIAGGGGGATRQSLLRRDYPPGTYYLALSVFNLANDQPSPPDDDYRAGFVLDFPGPTASSTVLAGQDVSFQVVHAGGVENLAAIREFPYEVKWYVFQVTNPLDRGACCLPDGTCQDLAPQRCGELAGEFGGAGSACLLRPCPAAGACCLPGGTCVAFTAAACARLGGAFRGENVACAPNPCVGACCLGDERCVRLDRAACAAYGGEFRGELTDCAPNPCVGRCCLEGGDCRQVSRATCLELGGAFHGDGTICTAGACPTGDPCAGVLLGDTDGSGAVNNFDIDAFVLAVSDPANYIARYCAEDVACLLCRADLDRSGSVNNFDIDAFVACLNALPPDGSGCR
jgi:hypothetical protein